MNHEIGYHEGVDERGDVCLISGMFTVSLQPVLTSRFDKAVVPVVAALRDTSLLQKATPNHDEVLFVIVSLSMSGS